jgi:hypothetical protein
MVLAPLGCAVAQAVSRWLPTGAARVRGGQIRHHNRHHGYYKNTQERKTPKHTGKILHI